MLYKRLKKTQLKLDREVRHNHFLKDCKFHKITPKFLQIRNKYLWTSFRTEVLRFEKKILNKVIKRRYAYIHKLKTEVTSITDSLKERTSPATLELQKMKISKIREFEANKHKHGLNKKLKFWLERSNQIPKKLPNEIPYINLSTYDFNTDEDKCLKLGPKFITHNKIDIKDAIPKIEQVLRGIPEDEASRIRNLAQNEFKKKLQKKNDIDTDKLKILKTLKNNKDLTFLKTDKTDRIAVMDRPHYIKMMEETIQEIGVIGVNKDPNTKIKNKAEEIMKNGHWPTNNKPNKTNFTPNTPSIFGKLKDHKHPMKIRPIVNKRTSPTYDLEKYLKTVFNELLPISNISINSTYQFINLISDYKPSPTDYLISLDVISLYPSINIDEIAQIINKKIEDTYQDNETQITLKSATNLVLKENNFKFNSQFYKQIKGVPMGSPISNTVAEWKMRLLESTILNELRDVFKFWVRYVDDIFAIVNRNTDLDSLLSKLNLYDSNIKFTLEKEVENSLAFLDVLIIRSENNLQTTVYRKPNSNTDIISYSAITPTQYKIAALNSYIHRALKICSNDSLLTSEINKIKDIAKRAGYSNYNIEKIINKAYNRYNTIDPAQKSIKFTNPIPFMQGISLKIKKELKKHDLNVPIAPNRSVFQLIRSDIENFHPHQTAGIYKIKFTDNTNKPGFYIGVTKRKIGERLKEHKSDIRLNRTNTALARLNYKSPLNVDFINVEKLAEYNNLNYGLMREAIEILLDPINNINDMTHSTVDNRWLCLLLENQNNKVTSIKRKQRITTEEA